MTKVHNKNLLLNLSSVYSEVLKEVDIMALYVYNSAKKLKVAVFTSFAKSPTLYWVSANPG